MLIYRNGTHYGRLCGMEERKAIIMISCERGVAAVRGVPRLGLQLGLWTNQLNFLAQNDMYFNTTHPFPVTFCLSQGQLSAIVEERDKLNNCFYLFELDSSAVCPVIPSHLSVGSVLLIV